MRVAGALGIGVREPLPSLALALLLASAPSPAESGGVPFPGLAPGPDAGTPRPSTDLLEMFDELEPSDLEGRRWTRADLRGRVVLLDVWATWCAPCLAELPTLRELRREHGSDLALLGLSVDRSSQATLRSFLGRHSVDWPQLWDGRGMAGPLVSRLGIDAIPRTFLFDARGRLVGVDLRGEGLRAAVDVLVENATRESAGPESTDPPRGDPGRPQAGS